MGIVIERAAADRPSQRQRWSNIFTIAYALVALFLALQIKNATESATVIYADPEVGVTVQYPQNWLLDTEGDAVLRVRNMAADGFKTSIQLQVLPVNIEITERNLIDNLVLSRSQTLASFDVLAREDITLGENERPATALTFTYVDKEPNPFLESVPRVIEGMDVLTTQGGQALIVTFLSDAATFDANFAIFQRFLDDLDF
jgi:hypothetical protein